MANQNSAGNSFASNDVTHPLNDNDISNLYPNTPAAYLLPIHLETVIGTVDANELVGLWARMTPALRDNILNVLPVHYAGETNMFRQTMHDWFRAVYGDHVGNNHNTRILDSLENFQVNRRPDIHTYIFGQDLITSRTLRLQYGAQAFIRGLFTDLFPQHPNLIHAFLTVLRPHQSMTATVPAQVNPFAPIIPQQSQPQPQPTQPTTAISPITAPVTDPSETAERYYWCPRCACKCSSTPGSFRNLHRHWFEGHARSNRSAVELKQKWDAGALGPWTAEEAKEKSSGVLETDAEEAERKRKRKGAKLWRERMQKDPEKWERVAQGEEGYPSYKEGFVSLKRKKIREAKEKVGRGKGKKEDGEDEKGGKKGKKK